MAGIATGVFKKLSRKKQAALKTQAPAGAGGTARYMRRVTSNLVKGKATYGSNEILPSQQRRDNRHGVVAVTGSISGELSAGAYQPEFESVLRQGAVAAITTGAVATISATTDGAGTYTGTYTRSAGSFLTDGFKIGQVVRIGGFTTTGAANNGRNYIITNVTALVMSIRSLNKSDVAANFAFDNVTITTAGKQTFIPATGQTRDYYTIEHWHSDIAQSEQFVDCVYTGFTATLPPSGLATIEWPVMGLDMVTGVAEYFTTPAAAATGGIMAAVNGVMIINGAVAANITGLTVVVNGNYSVPGGIVGSNVDPDVFPGVVEVSGQMTALFVDGTYRDLFLNETEATVAIALTANNTDGADFVCFSMGRFKFNGASKDDGQAGLTQTLPYVALERIDGNAAYLATTLAVQDSQFV